MLLSLLFQAPLVFLPVVMALIISLTFHEVSHGFVALWLGDTTARDQGRLSFNPLSHLDPMGTIMMLIVGFGWGKPVPINYYNLRAPKWGPAIVAMAGPASNLLLLIIFGIIYKIFAPAGINPYDLESVVNVSGNLMVILLSFLIVYNSVLMIFNLIPVPPLDGSKLLQAILPPKYDRFKKYLETRGPIILFTVLILDNLLNIGIFSSLFNVILGFFAKFF